MNSILLAFLIFGQASAAPPNAGSAENYLMGGPSSQVKIEIFSDFQCPSCRAFYLDTVTRLMEEYAAGGKVAVVFHDFPLLGHASSRVAARYALASKILGKEQYLNVVKYLYNCQAEWSWDGNIERVLARVLAPADLAKVKEKLKDPTIEQTIDHEVEQGNKRKISQTPTLIVTMGGKEQTVAAALSFTILKDFISPSLR